MKRKLQVKTVIFMTVKRQKYLSAGIFCAVVGAILLALVPPLILARIVDTITAGKTAACSFLLLYFAALAAAGFLESAREGLLTVFGQKITHALRSALMEKFTTLTADEMSRQEPGALVSRFGRRCGYRGKSVLHQGLSVCLQMHVKSSAFLW